MSRRARLRKQQIAEMETPETTGDLEKTDRMASLLMFGAPSGAKSAAQFGPRGFKAAKRTLPGIKKALMRTLKPILSKSAKAAK